MSMNKRFQIGMSLLAAIGFFTIAAPDMARAACEAGSAPDGQWQQQTSGGIIVHIICSHAAYRRATGQNQSHPISADQLQKEIQKQLDAKIKQEDAAKAAANQQAGLGNGGTPPGQGQPPAIKPCPGGAHPTDAQLSQCLDELGKIHDPKVDDLQKRVLQKLKEQEEKKKTTDVAATDCNLPPKQLTEQQLKRCLAKTVADYTHEQRGRDVLRPQDEAQPITPP